VALREGVHLAADWYGAPESATPPLLAA